VRPERVEEVIAALDRGETRVAERANGDWKVNEEAQEAILEYFRLRKMEPQEVGPFEYHDKIPLKRGYEELGVRVVPPAVARYGSFLSRGVVLMPSYVNIGAYVGDEDGEQGAGVGEQQAFARSSQSRFRHQSSSLGGSFASESDARRAD
jgi:2,3,4,5-tetrahydropyridine-2,6-dicarboxylate N-succinyltransferase